MKRVKGFKITNKVDELVNNLGSVGFQATRVKKAVNVIKKMKEEDVSIILTFTSNMVSSGLRELFAELVKRRFVSAIITGVGSVEEDLMKCSKPFLLGSFKLDDNELHQEGVNRIGNILVPNDRYEDLEETLWPFFEELLELQESKNRLLSPSEVIHELGKRVESEESILYWASKNNIPIFCPAILDGAFGLQLYYFKKEHPSIGIDVTRDMELEEDVIMKAGKTGGIILGGGFAKHHAIGLNIIRGGFDYAVYVTTANEYDGSLSGAPIEEAVSWSKVKEDARTASVHGDATIIAPLIFSTILNKG